MNNDETYTPCTKCGRPMAYCKGQCCGKPKGCQCKEYGPKVCGAIRPGEPKCPYQAVIPSLTVESVSNLKDLADCFVHVSDINTTFYIDDKHRITTIWAGPVEVDNYDYANNPLGLRSQMVYDFANSRAIYYNKTGAYEIIELGDSGSAVRISMEWDNSSEIWSRRYAIASYGALLQHSILDNGVVWGRVAAYDITDYVTFRDESTNTEISLSALYSLLESGTEVILDNVPLGAYRDVNSTGSDPVVSSVRPPLGVDNMELSGPGRFDPDSEGVSSLTRFTAVTVGRSGSYDTMLGVIIQKMGDTISSNSLSCLVQGYEWERV